MIPEYEIKSEQTLNLINNLLGQGITKISVLLRHSERFFSKDPLKEPFMGLTDKGKKSAFDLGANLGPEPVPVLYSSSIGRCIETAYLIDKGFCAGHNNITTDHNRLDDRLTPFYIKDMVKAVHMVQETGVSLFLRNWFDSAIDEAVMDNPADTANTLCKFMVEKIMGLQDNQICLCISHDWNIFPVREFKMGLKHETAGDVDYLDGVVFFEKKHQYFLTDSNTDPIRLS
jgi:hypothetical protein